MLSRVSSHPLCQAQEAVPYLCSEKWNARSSRGLGCSVICSVLHISFCWLILSVGVFWLQSPWTARRSSQSISKEINPEYSLGWLLLKLKLHYFGYLMASRLTGKDSDSGKDWRQKEKGWQRMRWLASIINWMDMNLSKFQEIMEDRGIHHATINGITKSRHDLVTEQ